MLQNEYTRSNKMFNSTINRCPPPLLKLMHTVITCTNLYSAKNHIFRTKNLYSPVWVFVSA